MQRRPVLELGLRRGDRHPPHARSHAPGSTPSHPVPPQEHTFYHDPNIMDPSAKGAMAKSLRWSRVENRGDERNPVMYFINVSIGGRDAPKAMVSVSLTQGEYYVFESVGAAAKGVHLGAARRGAAGRGFGLRWALGSAGLGAGVRRACV
jgi:hypothetical protein